MWMVVYCGLICLGIKEIARSSEPANSFVLSLIFGCLISLRKIWRLSPMTHCNVVALISDSKPLDVSLKQRFCKFSYGIFKHGSMVLKAIATVAKNNPFSVYGNNYVDISSMYNGDLVKFNILNTIYNKWVETISEELKSNVNVLQEMIEIRDGVKACVSLCMDDVQFIIDDICIN